MLKDPVELNKLLLTKTKRKETPTPAMATATHRLSLPAVVRKNEKMPKLVTKKLNKSLNAKEDIFDFNDSISDTFPVVEKTYSSKRKIDKNDKLGNNLIILIFTCM